MLRDLRGQVLIVTGASAGIGAATAVAAAGAGMRVVLAARRAERIEQIAELCRQAAGPTGDEDPVLIVPTDVRSDDQVLHLAQTTLERFGRIDAAFANAGYGLYKPVDQTTDEQWRDILDVNFHGTLRLIRAVLPAMRAQGGGHLLIGSSALSKLGIPMYGAYSASKSAQHAVASALRAELARENIHVSSVHPIGTDTEFFDVVERVSELGDPPPSNTPAWLVQSPERVARAILRCLRRPKAEVWPSVGARWGLALTTALPGVGAWAMHRLVRRHRLR